MEYSQKGRGKQSEVAGISPATLGRDHTVRRHQRGILAVRASESQRDWPAKARLTGQQDWLK